MSDYNQSEIPRKDAVMVLEDGLHTASRFLSDMIHDAGTDAELKIRAIELSLEVHQHLLALGEEVETRNDVAPVPRVTKSHDREDDVEETF